MEKKTYDENSTSKKNNIIKRIKMGKIITNSISTWFDW